MGKSFYQIRLRFFASLRLKDGELQDEDILGLSMQTIRKGSSSHTVAQPICQLYKLT